MDVTKAHKLVSKHEFELHLTYQKRIESFQIFDLEINDGQKIAKLKSYSIYVYIYIFTFF